MNETQIIEVANADWHARNLSVPRETLLAGVERGKVLYFPNLRFAIEGGEQALLDPALAEPSRKNISLEPNGGALHGVAGDAVTQSAVRALIARYQVNARALVDGLFPEYNGRLRVAPTSLRLHQVETRDTSWRKDDSRLHVDAFPSRPNRGVRILRVFCNVNPNGEDRVWRVGEAFEPMAQQFLPGIRAMLPGEAAILSALRVTKSARSEYDHLMLGLHDAAKGDLGYQHASEQREVRFAPGTTWICFSDQVMHAASSGQYMLEQTTHLPIDALYEPHRSPLAVLERMTGRTLISRPSPASPRSAPSPQGEEGRGEGA